MRPTSMLMAEVCTPPVPCQSTSLLLPGTSPALQTTCRTTDCRTLHANWHQVTQALSHYKRCVHSKQEQQL